MATILIKKYENRRLYDATNSRYVNLDDVARMLQNGDEVRVIDVATGDDITRLILTQIIVEGAKARDSGFPLDVLRDMVIASGRASQESAIRYTRAMLDLYKSTYQAMSPAFNPFAFVQGTGMPASQDAPAPSAPPAPPSSPPSASSPEAAPRPEEVSNLKQRVADLEKLVASLAAVGRPSGSKTGRKKPRRRARPS
jgi:polyhydroxyalkanoate synthesis repressor PhaR